MTSFIIIRYLHFIGIFLVVGTLCAEMFMIKASHTRKELGRLAKIDGIYGLGALITVTAGLLMWFWVGKPASFYSQNWVFHLKVTLFVIVGIMSIWPTLFFIKNRKGNSEELVEVPRKIRAIIKAEVHLLAIIPLLAVLMALGKGAF